MRKSKLLKPTLAEDRRINAGIARDPDTYELCDTEFAELKPVLRGRPKNAVHKVPVTVRLDAEIVDFFRGSGHGWQTRMNAALSGYVKRRRA